MLNPKQQEHIRRKVEQVAILTSVLRDTYFSTISEKEFAGLREVLYSKLKDRLEKLESKINLPINDRVKKAAEQLQVGIVNHLPQSPQYFENSHFQKRKLLV